MEVISQASKTILAILKAPKQVDSGYRYMRYCVENILENGVLLYHQLTKELLLLTMDEYANRMESAYLREHWFLVPEDTQDRQYADLVRWVLSARQKKSKDITGYTIFTTTDCNARCFYCYELGRSRIPMSLETAGKVVRYIREHCGGNKVSIAWFGGEPLYNLQAIDTICTGLREAGIEFTSKMTTNAYLFDEAALEKAGKLWNLKRVQITLDGTETVYNRIKAYVNPEENPYQRVLRNIQSLLDASVKVSIRMNMDLHNAENLLELARELSHRFSHRKDIVVYAHHLFKGNESLADAHTREEWLLRDEAMHRIEAQLDESGLSIRSGISKKMRISHCMADSDSKVTILPDGSIGVCEHYSETEFVGHVDREGFDAGIVNSWKEKTPAVEACDTCFYYPDCIMLKKCPNGSKCFLQYREGLYRKTLRQMENEYRRWLNQEEQLDAGEEIC